jgi:hypothetical protein
VSGFISQLSDDESSLRDDLSDSEGLAEYRRNKELVVDGERYIYIYCMLNTLTNIPFLRILSMEDLKVYREILNDVSRDKELDLKGVLMVLVGD